ncbi:MAG TPA: triose-phosphate isomerase [Thermodesulfobacteriota bacterium]
MGAPGRRPLLAGNWKLHGRLAEAAALAGAVRDAVAGTSGRDVVLCPPFTAVAEVARVLAGSPIAVGGQDCFWEPKGAFTGEVSAEMLKDAGASFVIVGHSERRQYFGETDETVARKVAAARRAGLVPILCVGERLEEREAGRTLEVVSRQVTAGLAGVSPADAEAGRLVVAYEPVWAIGTGRTATPAQAQEVHAAIRRLLAERFGAAAASAVRIQYGGSVKPDNIDALMAEPDIDGALVGGASLDAAGFARIVGFKESLP